MRPLMLYYSLEIFTNIQPVVGIILRSPHVTSRIKCVQDGELTDTIVRDDMDHSSSDWSCKKAIILLALIWTSFVNLNGRDKMIEDTRAYQPFLWCFAFAFIVLVVFRVGSFILFWVILRHISSSFRSTSRWSTQNRFFKLLHVLWKLQNVTSSAYTKARETSEFHI